MRSRAALFVLFALALCAMVSVVSAQPALATVAAPVNAGYTQEQLLNDLTRQLIDRFQLHGELLLELAHPWEPPSAPAGSVEAVMLNCPSRLSPSLLLQVRLQSEGRALGDFTLMLKAQLFREVWVARIPVERGTSFDPNQLDTRRVDVLQQRDTVPTDNTEADLTYACSVPANRLLGWRDLARRPLVRKGQMIEVAAIDGMLTITTKALALENGAAGEMVKLRNIESKKDFTALVVAEARAQVHF